MAAAIYLKWRAGIALLTAALAPEIINEDLFRLGQLMTQHALNAMRRQQQLEELDEDEDEEEEEGFRRKGDAIRKSEEYLRIMLGQVNGRWFVNALR